MTITRILTLALALAFGSLALAQDVPRVVLVANVLANDMDGTMVDCLVDFDLPTACFTYPMDVEWTKMRVERAVRSYNDLTWMVPWQTHGDIIMRVLRIVGADDWVVSVSAVSPSLTLVFVSTMPEEN